MNNFISVIFIETNSILNEKIGVGLLAIAGDKVFFEVSSHKVKIAAKLVDTHIQKHADYTFDLLKSKVDEYNTEELSKINYKNLEFFNKDYFVYLHKYSQGLFQFDMPKPYAADINNVTFKKLFEQFIGSWKWAKYSNIQSHHTHFSTSIKTKLRNTIFEEKADIDYKLLPEKVEGLLMPKDITLISKNGSLLGAQAIDFTLGIETVVKKVYEYEVMIAALEKFSLKNFGTGNKGNYIMLFNSPEKKSQQEKLLNDIRRTKPEMKPESEDYLTELEEKMTKNHYDKFSNYLI